MFIRAQSKQRFGDLREPYINVDLIVSAEIGHAQTGEVLNVKLANGEEMIVSGENATRFLAYLEQNQLR